jgi:hypothetical protein
MKLLHCRQAIVVEEQYRLLGREIDLSTPFVDVVIGKCRHCGKRVAFIKPFNPLKEEENTPYCEVKKSKMAQILQATAHTGQVFKQNGCDWVWGSSSAFPFTKRKVKVK